MQLGFWQSWLRRKLLQYLVVPNDARRILPSIALLSTLRTQVAASRLRANVMYALTDGLDPETWWTLLLTDTFRILPYLPKKSWRHSSESSAATRCGSPTT